MVVSICCQTVNGQKDHTKVKEHGHFENTWHPQVQQPQPQQQPVSNIR